MGEFVYFFRDYHNECDKGSYFTVVAENRVDADVKAERALNILANRKQTVLQWFRCGGVFNVDLKYTNDYRRVEQAVA